MTFDPTFAHTRETLAGNLAVLNMASSLSSQSNDHDEPHSTGEQVDADNVPGITILNLYNNKINHKIKQNLISRV